MANRALLTEIRAIPVESRRTYRGSPSLFNTLHGRNHRVSEKRMGREAEA